MILFIASPWCPFKGGPHWPWELDWSVGVPFFLASALHELMLEVSMVAHSLQFSFIPPPSA